MIRSILFCLFCLAAQFGFSQAEVNSYDFNTATLGFYAPLSGATDVTNGDIWDDEEYVIAMPSGSNFQFAGTPITEVMIETNGILILNSDINTMLVPFYADLIDRTDFTGDSLGVSPIYFDISGTAGSQVMTVEWANAGFFDGDSLDYVNFQVRLFEADQRVEFAYGTSMIVNTVDAFDGESGPAVGIIAWDDIAEEVAGGTTLLGDPNNPMSMTPQPVDLTFLTGLPVDGMIYDWYLITASSQELPNGLEAMTLFPTLVQGNQLTVSLDLTHTLDATLIISNQVGQIVQQNAYTFDAGSQQFELSVEGLAAGAYQVSIIDGTRSISSRFVKID